MCDTVRLCLWILATVLCAMVAAGVSWAEPQLVYSEDWSDGDGGWSWTQSMAGIKRPAQRIYVGHPLVKYAIWFYGSCTWGFQYRTIPEVPLKISTTAVIYGPNRNALSVNVRTSGGAPIYKYGFCTGRIGANKQPPTWSYRDTDLAYDAEVPYELYSIWIPNSGVFALGLKNLLTGEDKLSGYWWGCRSQAVPAWIDIDQEGGRGPAALLKVDVYAGW